MFKRSIFLVLLVALLLVSCSTKTDNTKSTDLSSRGSTQQIQESQEMPTVTSKDGATLITEDSMIIKTGDYEILGSKCEYLSDDDMSSAWFFEYTTGTESPCDFQVWMTSNVNTMTTVQVKLTVLNLSDEERIMTELVKPTVVHDGKKAADVTVMQINPDQVTTDGYQVPSTVPVALKQGEQADIVFLFDIKKSDMTDGKDLDLKFDLSSDSYIIDLAKDLKPRKR